MVNGGLALELEFMTLAEVAALTRRSPAAIYTARHRRSHGQNGAAPPAYRIGGRILFKRTDVDAWIEAAADPPLERMEGVAS
jgi:predicted DNA-binding transcriptional regulator AlpA